MANMDTPFAPAVLGGTVGATVAIVMATGAPAASLATVTAPGYTNAVCVTNTATLPAFVAVVITSNYTVTELDTPILANSRAILAAPEGPAVFYVGAKPSATLAVASTIYFTPGEGGGCQS